MSHTFDTPTKKVFCFQLPTAWTFHICVVEMSQCLCLLCKNKWNKKHIQKKRSTSTLTSIPSENIDTQTIYPCFQQGHTFSKPSILGIYIKTSGVPIPSPETPKALGCDGARVVLVTIRRHQRQHQVRRRGFLTGSGWKRVDVKRMTSLHQVYNSCSCNYLGFTIIIDHH